MRDTLPEARIEFIFNFVILDRFGSLLTSWSSRESRLNEKGGHHGHEDDDEIMGQKGISGLTYGSVTSGLTSGFNSNPIIDSTIGAESARGGGGNSDFGDNQDDYFGAIDIDDIEVDNEYDDLDDLANEMEIEAELDQYNDEINNDEY